MSSALTAVSGRTMKCRSGSSPHQPERERLVPGLAAPVLGPIDQDYAVGEGVGEVVLQTFAFNRDDGGLLSRSFHPILIKRNSNHTGTVRESFTGASPV